MSTSKRTRVRWHSVAVIGACLLATTPTLALTDRADLEKWCTHGSSVAAGRCIGYLLAAEDALATGPIDGIRACVPATIRLQEQHQLVVDWLAAHPQATAPSALTFVARAYAERYPCRD